MKVYELLKFGAETLKTMSRNGIYLNDYKYLEAYEQYRHMRCVGVKYEAAVTELAWRFHIAKRTLQRAFKRLSKEC